VALDHEFNMHILIYGGGIQKTLGGVVRWMADMSNTLAKNGYQVTLIGHGEKGDAPYYEIDNRVQFHLVKPPSPNIKSQKRLRTLVKRANPDVVLLIFSNRIGFHAMFAIRGLGIPIIRSERGDPDYLVPQIAVWNNISRLRELS